MSEREPAGDIDWQLIRSFAGVMREGNLTRAAKALGLTQPTLGRHIRELERLAGETLFARKANRFVPTEAARSFFARAQEIEAAVTALARAMARPPDEGRGTVRITASGILGVELLPTLLPGLLALDPDLDVEIVATDGVDNILRRDADIAIRHLPPEQGDLIAKRIGEIGVGLYAARRYLQANGRPADFEDLAAHTFISNENGAEARAFARSRGAEAMTDRLRVRTDNRPAQIRAMQAGAGITACHHWLAARLPDVERVLAEVEVAKLPVFLVAHDDLRRSRRLRAVFDFLVERLPAEFRSAARA